MEFLNALYMSTSTQNQYLSTLLCGYLLPQGNEIEKNWEYNENGWDVGQCCTIKG